MRKNKKLKRLMKAAKMGKPYAMYMLGIRYELGCGVPLDLGEAAYWIGEAADEGYQPAEEWISDYYFDDNACLQAKS